MSKRERLIREELRYRQMIVRMDINSLKRSIAACKEIAAQLREEQKERHSQPARQNKTTAAGEPRTD